MRLHIVTQAIVNGFASAKTRERQSKRVDVETGTLDGVDEFPNFALYEKDRLPDDRPKRSNDNKVTGLDDLKKFSRNFKLHTPVPLDLVDILRKQPKNQPKQRSPNLRSGSRTAQHKAKPRHKFSGPASDKQ